MLFYYGLMKLSKKKEEHLKNVMNVMTEEQLESLFFLMQEMFMEVVMGITPEEDNSNDSDDSDDHSFTDNNPQPRVEKIDSPVDEEFIEQIRAVNSIKRKANDAVSNWMNDLFKRPERKKS